MRPTSDSLAARRPALAALLGIDPVEGNFGADSTFGSEFGFGDEMEGEFGFERPWAPLEQEMGVQRNELVADQRQLQKYRNLEARREERSLVHELEMDPNAGQSLKLGRYSFGLSQTITIGVATGLYMSDSPATSLRTKRVIMNAPTVGFATISAVLIANVTTTVGGAEDAFAYSAQSFGNNVDYPTLPPSQKATVTGNYTSLAPAPLANGQSFLFTVRFSGISTIAGGA